jgi:hypothetical protein
MNQYLIRMTDKIQILSIYFAFILDMPSLVKLFFLLSIIFYTLSLVNNATFSKRATLFVLIVFVMFEFLFLVGMLKGNNFDDAFKFVLPVFTLLNIHIYIELSKHYDLKRYLFHYYVVSILIALKILLLAFLFANNLFMEYLPIFDIDKNQSTWIGFNSGTLRIFVGQAFILPIGLLLSHYLSGKIPFLIAPLFLFALLLTQTTALWITYFLVLAYLIIARYKGMYIYSALFIASLFIGGLSAANIDLLIDVLDEKLLNSAPVKVQQIDIALNMLGENLFFGGGLGHIFPNGANTIEVVVLHILSSTGIVGFIFYAYMFFYWSVVSFRLTFSDGMIRVIFLSFMTIVIASFSNPYLIGGNSGLFLIPILAARFIQLRQVRGPQATKHIKETLINKYRSI